MSAVTNRYSTNANITEQRKQNSKSRRNHSRLTPSARRKKLAHALWFRGTVKVTSPRGTVRHSPQKHVRSANKHRSFSPHKLYPGRRSTIKSASNP